MSIIDFIYIFFFAIMIFSAVLWLIVYYTNLGKIVKDPLPDDLKDVTFLVPAYNEEEYVGKTIEALLDLDYPEEKLEIIAINDGSEDNTLEVLKQYDEEIEIIDKENTGKANSMNQALEEVDTELVASMDADSYPSENFLKNMVGYFNDEEVYGVTPALKILRDDKVVEKIQWTEYIYQIFLRKVFALFQVQYVLPGPGSIYRTSFLDETGGWREDTHTEDMEMAFRMMDEGKKIENSTNGMVWTDPPSTFRSLFRQRIRWYRGYVENFISYRNMFLDPGSGNLGFFLLPLNVLWIFMLMFILVHVTYNILSIFFEWANMYILLGYIPFELTFSVQQLHFFHIFIIFFMSTGIGMVFLSLFSAGEKLNIKEKKINYLTFFTIYPYLFAMFWLATFFEMARDNEVIKW